MTRAPEGVYALRYATRTNSVRGEHFYGHLSGCMEAWPIHYYTWAIVHDSGVVVFDAGFTPDEAARRGSREYEATPIELLCELGVGPEEVQDLVLSHLHYDHTGFVDAYPNARVHIQGDEIDFWRGDIASRGAFTHLSNVDDLESLALIEKEGRLVRGSGDFTLHHSISVHQVGGHTAGMQVMRVVTPGGIIVLASDASHFYSNFEDDLPYSIVHELPLMYQAFDRLRTLAGPGGVIVPGHDPEVAVRHPGRYGISGSVIRLTNTQTKEQP